MLVMITADWEVINIGGGRYTNVIVYSYQNITVFPINRYNYSHNRKNIFEAKNNAQKGNEDNQTVLSFSFEFCKVKFIYS